MSEDAERRDDQDPAPTKHSDAQRLGGGPGVQDPEQAQDTSDDSDGDRGGQERT